MTVSWRLKDVNHMNSMPAQDLKENSTKFTQNDHERKVKDILFPI